MDFKLGRGLRLNVGMDIMITPKKPIIYKGISTFVEMAIKI